MLARIWRIFFAVDNEDRFDNRSNLLCDTRISCVPRFNSRNRKAERLSELKAHRKYH
jgi:hypothetical protein